MAQRLPDQMRFTPTGRIFTDVPAFAVDTGSAWRAVAAIGNDLGNTLAGYAADAVRTESELAGLNAGQRAVAAFLAKRKAERSASARVTGLPENLNSAIDLAAGKYGVNAETLRMIAKIESGGNPNAKNPNSSAGGAFQFTDATARQYGLKNRFDVTSAADAAARLARDNADQLRQVLGRDPSPAELYLAHQQGAGGAAKLLRDPNARAVDVVGRDAVTLNGGRADMSAAEFAGLWLKKAGGKTSPQTPQPQTGLPTAPLALRPDATIAGQAYNDAAIRAASWRLSASLSQDIGAIYQQYRDNPSQLTAELTKLHDTYVQDAGLSDPRMREVFDKQFVERSQAYQLDALNLQGQRLRQEEQTAAATGIDAGIADMERQAYALGANGQTGQLLDSQVQRLEAGIGAAAADGLITAPDAEKAKRDLGRTVFMARTQGVFDNLPTPAAKQEFAQQILDDYAAGKGPFGKLSLSEAKTLSDQLFASAFDAQNKAQAMGKKEIARLKGLMGDDLASVAQTGQGLDFASANFDPEKASALLGPDAMALWQDKRAAARRQWEATAGMETETAAEIANRIDMLKPQAGAPDYAQQAQIHTEAMQRARAVLKERQMDPLGQAERANVVDLAPIDASSPDTLANSLAERANAARQVAGMYGTPYTVFKPQERTHIADALMNNPELLPGFAQSVVTAFGKDAPKALAEISDQGPVLAHVAAIELSNGDNSLAYDVAQTLAARKDGAYKLKMPSDAKFAKTMAAATGGALVTSPQLQSSVMATAQLLYERQAQLQGFDASEADQPGTTAAKVFAQSINRALGATTRDGRQFGGLVNVNGTNTIAPPDMPAEAIEKAVRNISPETLAGQMGMGTANGVPISTDQLRRAKLVAVGDGKYLMALGDPQSPDPRFVPGDGPRGLFELDIRTLADAQAAQQPTSGGWLGLPIGGLN